MEVGRRPTRVIRRREASILLLSTTAPQASAFVYSPSVRTLAGRNIVSTTIYHLSIRFPYTAP